MAKGEITPGLVAFVFPGQGSQKVGMGKEAYDTSPVAKATFDEADLSLAQELSKLCFEGPDEDLRLTRNTQPAVLTNSIALLRMLDAKPDVVAGHSLGEYSAHVAAGTIRFTDAVKVVRARGEYMQEAVPVGVGAMAAVLKMDRAPLEKICEETAGVVEAVNYNAPGQIVIAGEVAAVQAAAEKAKAQGARVMALPVSAPFHCQLMRPAEEKLAPHLRDMDFEAPRVPVYVNVDAVAVLTGDAARDALVRQVSRPVRWDESVLRMVADGVTLFVEIGMGSALAGMIKRTTDGATSVNLQGPSDLDKVREAIAAARA